MNQCSANLRKLRLSENEPTAFDVGFRSPAAAPPAAAPPAILDELHHWVRDGHCLVLGDFSARNISWVDGFCLRGDNVFSRDLLDTWGFGSVPTISRSYQNYCITGVHYGPGWPRGGRMSNVWINNLLVLPITAHL